MNANIRRWDVVIFLISILSVVFVALGQALVILVVPLLPLQNYLPVSATILFIPAALLTFIPAVLAFRRYTRKTALVYTAVVYIACLGSAYAGLKLFWAIG